MVPGHQKLLDYYGPFLVRLYWRFYGNSSNMAANQDVSDFVGLTLILFIPVIEVFQFSPLLTIESN